MKRMIAAAWLCLSMPAMAAETIFFAGQPDWLVTPQGAEAGLKYPVEAMKAQVEGDVLLACHPVTEGAIACAVVRETPGGFGFGEAALRYARGFRLTEASAEDVLASGKPLALAFTFHVSKPGPT